ncbi:Dynein assembly factor 4, axonemal isoform 3 [Schistosoma japonicum]|uniref:Dynein assembly factor 4, axonemal isoform 3 n=1 Tax=Schistosoma japonicum TaxID=6182 RepID=A0A4Z2D017_SCHJA|nr:Dynein assembly factor 4, axonemal isoform 3 [Schistosoma japonicum]
MYITITDFRWCENLSDVELIVPLHGANATNADTFFTSQYIKVVVKPYIFECVLYKPINVEESTLKLIDGVAQFNLRKSNAELWGQITSDHMNDRKQLLQIKQNAILEHQEWEVKRIKANKEMNKIGEKYSLEQVMKLENLSRERIKLEKEEAGKQAINEFVNNCNALKQEEDDMQNRIKEARIFAKQYTIQTLNDKNIHKNIHKTPVLIEKPVDLPVRTSSTIDVKFTPRIFPTPERESTKEAENEWLNKQAEYRRKLMDRVVPDDLSRNELDPIWLRKKGDSLFQTGDYEAAVIAYTEAISQNPKLHSAYSNRAACHLQLRNYFKALEDSSMVLDLCVPPVAQNLKSRVRAHIRRGVAFCNLQLYKEGLIEYKAAERLQPDDDTIKVDIENLEKFINQKQ